MWIFTRYGFFSIVALKDDPSQVMVRARARAHLSMLQARADVGASSWARQVGKAEILEQPESDYQWRIIVPKVAMADLVEELTLEIDWNNFKTEVGRFQGHGGAYLGALHDVWMILWRLQNRGA